jgi:hypothetical protein
LTYLLMVSECSNRCVFHQKLIFFVFAIIWSFYGIAYYLDIENKNIMYNFLDVISKSGFGLFMWLYYGKVFTL